MTLNNVNGLIIKLLGTLSNFFTTHLPKRDTSRVRWVIEIRSFSETSPSSIICQNITNCLPRAFRHYFQFKKSIDFVANITR